MTTLDLQVLTIVCGWFVAFNASGKVRQPKGKCCKRGISHFLRRKYLSIGARLKDRYVQYLLNLAPRSDSVPHHQPQYTYLFPSLDPCFHRTNSSPNFHPFSVPARGRGVLLWSKRTISTSQPNRSRRGLVLMIQVSTAPSHRQAERVSMSGLCLVDSDRNSGYGRGI